MMCIPTLWITFYFAVTHAHVKFFFSASNVNLESRPVRNAPAPSSDGRMSTGGPCGGVEAWGANGSSNISVGQVLNMKINYNGGHRSPANNFKALWACDSPTESDLEALIPNNLGDTFAPSSNFFDMNCDANGCTGDCVLENCPVPIASQREAGMYCPATQGNSVTGGYIFKCTIPDVSNFRGRCTVSVSDQRKWGGCYDLIVDEGPTQAPTVVVNVETSPVNNPAVSKNVGRYYYEKSNEIQTAEAGATCCSLDYGEFVVYENRATFSMMVNVKAEGACPDKDGQSVSFSRFMLATLTQDEGAETWRGTISRLGPNEGQDFELSISEGLLMLSNLDPEDPQICDGNFVRTAGASLSSMSSRASMLLSSVAVIALTLF